MPVKVKCRGCEKVLNVPDKALGKSVRCPNCQAVLKIPAAKSTSGGARKQAKTRPQQPAAAPRDEDDFLGGVDLRRAVDRRVRVCVKCGAEAPEVDEDEEEAIDCAECGHNIDTGVMSEYIRKKRSRRGPDPEEFWGAMWSESLAFVKKNPKLAFRTGGYWTLFGSLALFCSFLAVWYSSWPPVVFTLGVLSWLCSLGIGGWYWHVSVHIMRNPKVRKKEIDDIKFDFFSNTALGLKASIWPSVLTIPLILAGSLFLSAMFTSSGNFDDPLSTVTGYYGDYQIPVFILQLLTYIFCVLVFPVAMIHMAMPYTYKAWLPVNMAVIFAKNAAACLYWVMIAIAVHLPFIIILLVFALLVPDAIMGLYADALSGLHDLTVSIVDDEDNSGFLYNCVMLPAIYLAIVTAVAPIAILMAFPALFCIRANSMILVYFRDRLELVHEQKPGVLCGFGPRYLAWIVDWFIIVVFEVVLLLIVVFGGIGLVVIGMGYLANLIAFAWFASLLVIPWLYFSRPQSASSVRASIGKHSLGIIVQKENGDPMNFGEATGRHFVNRFVSQLFFGVGCFMAAFTEKKQALHDTMLKTEVVWKGDDERKLYE